jgi:hypothetical protein
MHGALNVKAFKDPPHLVQLVGLMKERFEAR